MNNKKVEEAPLSGLTGEWSSLPKDDRLLAAMGHFGAVIPLVGLTLPGAIYGLNPDKPLVRFHALQAALFQAISLAFLFVLFVANFFAYLMLSVAQGFQQGSGGQVYFLVPLGLSCVSFFSYLVTVGYGFLGVGTVLSGKHFRYLLVGAWTDAFLTEDPVGNHQDEQD